MHGMDSAKAPRTTSKNFMSVVSGDCRWNGPALNAEEKQTGRSCLHCVSKADGRLKTRENKCLGWANLANVGKFIWGMCSEPLFWYFASKRTANCCVCFRFASWNICRRIAHTSQGQLFIGSWLHHYSQIVQFSLSAMLTFVKFVIVCFD